VFDAVKKQQPDLASEPWPLISTEAKAVISAMLHKDPKTAHGRGAAQVRPSPLLWPSLRLSDPPLPCTCPAPLQLPLPTAPVFSRTPSSLLRPANSRHPLRSMHSGGSGHESDFMLGHAWVGRVGAWVRGRAVYQWIQGKRADAPLAAIILPRMLHFSKMSNLRHLALLVTSQFLPEDQMASVHAVFESVDEAGSGRLSLEEVRAALKKVRAHMRDDEVDALFKSVSSPAATPRPAPFMPSYYRPLSASSKERSHFVPPVNGLPDSLRALHQSARVLSHSGLTAHGRHAGEAEPLGEQELGQLPWGVRVGGREPQRDGELHGVRGGHGGDQQGEDTGRPCGAPSSRWTRRARGASVWRTLRSSAWTTSWGRRTKSWACSRASARGTAGAGQSPRCYAC